MTVLIILSYARRISLECDVVAIGIAIEKGKANFTASPSPHKQTLALNHYTTTTCRESNNIGKQQINIILHY